MSILPPRNKKHAMEPTSQRKTKPMQASIYFCIVTICVPSPPPACETQDMLDKAQELNTSASEVFEYIARCKKCGTSSGVGSAGGGARTSSASGIKRGDAGKIVDTSSAARPEGPNGTTLRPGTALTKVNISCAYT